MRDCFFDILSHLERAKRKDPRSSFTDILHKCGVNELEIGHNIINNWTNPIKIKDNRADTDEEVLNRLTTYWLSQKGEEYKKEIKDKSTPG